jgi:hypothetical protein
VKRQKKTWEGPFKCPRCRVVWPQEVTGPWPAGGIPRKQCEACDAEKTKEEPDKAAKAIEFEEYRKAAAAAEEAAQRERQARLKKARGNQNDDELTRTWLGLYPKGWDERHEELRQQRAFERLRQALLKSGVVRESNGHVRMRRDNDTKDTSLE